MMRDELKESLRRGLRCSSSCSRMPRRVFGPSRVAARFAGSDAVDQCDEALDGLGDVLAQIVRGERLRPAEKYDAFIAMLNRDASDARAAVGLVLAQPSISSQLIDNLNASIHLRALLTDLFLIDEIVRAENVSSSVPLVE